jgi:hypothetical protein
MERLRALSWDGVISVAELVRAGVPERTVYRRTQDDGPWTLLLPATILLSNGAGTPRQLEIGALVYAGADAMLTGISGARHHGLRRGSDPGFVHTLIPAQRQVLSAGHVVVERTRRYPRPVLRDGMAVAPLVRSVTDGVRRIKDKTEIAAILTEPVQRRMLLPEHLRLELDAGCRKGTAAPRRVLEGVGAGVWSAAEFDARDFWLSTEDFPPICWNVPVYDEHGVFVAIVDGLVEDLGFVWQIDSVEHHFATPEQVQATLEYHRRLRNVGLHVVSTRPAQVRDDPVGAREDIRGGLATARLLPPARIRIGH